MSDKDDALQELNDLKSKLDKGLILVENGSSSYNDRFSIYILPYDTAAEIQKSVDWAIKHVTSIKENADE